MHRYGLNAEWFRRIASGDKTVEFMLNDAKRRKLRLMHVIEFTNIESGETVRRTVVKIEKYSSPRRAVWAHYEDTRERSELVKALRLIYSEGDVKRLGVLAITLGE